MGVQTDRRERISLVGAIAGVVCFQVVFCPDRLACALHLLGGGTARVLALVGQTERTWAIERAARVRAIAADKGNRPALRDRSDETCLRRTNARPGARSRRSGGHRHPRSSLYSHLPTRPAEMLTD